LVVKKLKLGKIIALIIAVKMKNTKKNNFPHKKNHPKISLTVFEFPT